MDEEDRIFKEQLNLLPADLKGAVGAVPWKELIKEIGANHNLSMEQCDTLEMETMFILYRFDEANSYIDNIVNEVGVGKEIAISIGKEVNEKIFKLISDELKEEANSSTSQEKMLPESPVSETKEEATARLKERIKMGSIEDLKKEPLPAIHNSLPMVEPGEVAHDVPHVEEKTPVPPPPQTPQPVPPEEKPTTPSTETSQPTPQPEAPKKEGGEPTSSYNPKYPDGKDPYREPLE